MEQKNSRKRLNSLILLVAFTAVMLIVSTYAWFSTQKNVTLGGLTGHVNVAEGLQISLDALNWANEIDLGDILTNGHNSEYFKQTNINNGLTNIQVDGADKTADYAFSLARPYPLTVDGDAADVKDKYTYHRNIIPGELLPVSTIARDSIGEGLTSLKMYRGNNTDGIVLSDIHEVKLFEEDERNEEPGFYAIDFFLQNSSSSKATENPESPIYDWLQLQNYSTVTLPNNTWSTGLQNTLRVAFVLYDNDGGVEGDNDIKVDKTPGQMDIINATKGNDIIDIAIWEPNASGTGFKGTGSAATATTGFPAHVDTIVQTNNRLSLSDDDVTKYTGVTEIENGKHRFASDTLLPTYALTAQSVTKATIDNIYNWNITDSNSDLIDDATGLGMQYTLQTSTDGVIAGGSTDEAKQLVSAKDGTSKFQIAPSEYHRLTMYVWLEGQDVDTTNWASLGGDVKVDIGLSKPGTDKQS